MNEPAAPVAPIAPMPKARAWGVGFLVWTLVALAFAGQHFLTSAKVGVSVSWHVAVAGALADWYLFALLSVPALRLANRFRLAGPHWHLRLVLHLTAGTVFSLIWILFRSGLAEVLVPLRGVEKPFNEVLRYVLAATFFFNMLVYWVVVTGAHARAYYYSFLERERRVMDLESRLTSARLETLQTQLNPHFLFNALNGISTLMYRDVDTADRMLLTLADLLRSTLEQGQKHTVLLREELTFIDRYLVLEQMRFGDRLQVKREIDPATLDCRVPVLIIQPLIENALKHGLSGKKEPGTLILRSWIEGNDQLILEVEDNGAGLKPEPISESQATDKPKNPGGTGIGLVNIRARLHQLFGTDATLQLEPGDAGGARARISLPSQRK